MTIEKLDGEWRVKKEGCLEQIVSKGHVLAAILDHMDKDQVRL